VSFPGGWKTQNMTQAVVAGSPQQDAAIQLTVAQGSVDAAANTFFGQQGVQSSQVGRDNINGLPAVTGYFRATTQQGQTVEGLASFISYGGNTYQLVSYTTGGRLQSYDGTFRSVARSFGPLNDPQALNVQPNRIHVVRLSTPMSLTEFNRRNPSVVPIQELSIINQVESVDATLPAGTSVKRVTAS
jgi:predicted Zn-dependent protease